MSRIRILPEVVQNQIAAGEVVERPASVVKELVENALDAGARRISVEIEEGGRRFLRISDDGCGMDADDLALAMERHATSKIAVVEDVFRIATLGFRGEALPSIGSVSRLSIASALHGGASGNRIEIEGGKTLRLAPVPPRAGTVVEVRDLFFNTPARLKFLRAPAAETAAVAETLIRLALARPEVAFLLVSNGATALEVPAHPSLADRVVALFGRDLAGRLAPVCHETGEGLRIEGLAARPPESRPNSTGIYLFLNRRWIRHPAMARVAADAYAGQLPPRRYPFAVLRLEIDPARVDVNVHPTKEEVRFEEERRIVGAVRRAIEEALVPSPASAPAPAGLPVPAVRPSAAPLPERGEPSPPRIAEAAALPVSRPDSGRKPSPVPAAPPPPAAPSAPAEAQAALALGPQRRHRLLGQAGRRYLVVEAEDGIRIFDQHALHERWNYEQLRAREGPAASQRLLVPAVVQFAPAEAALIEEALPALREAGFEVERFGEAALSVSAAPSLIPPSGIERVLRDALAEIGGARNAVEPFRERLLRSLACRSAVLFGAPLAEGELLALLDRFAEARQPLTCPHGRPTSWSIPWSDLERRFGR